MPERSYLCKEKNCSCDCQWDFRPSACCLQLEVLLMSLTFSDLRYLSAGVW